MSDLCKQIADLLEERAKKVKPEWMCWIHNHEQDEDGDYCPECIEKLAAEKGLDADGGWEDYFESDSPRYCDTCGVLLYHSLTRHGVVDALAAFAEDGINADTSAWVLHNLVDGIGDLDEEEDTPLLRKILKKLKAERKEEAKV